MPKSARIFVAGHRGLVGSGIVRALEKAGYKNLILASSRELDLRDQKAVKDFFAKKNPEYVFLAAAKVGGIVGNDKYPAEFIRDNLLIEANVIHESHVQNVKKLLFLSTACAYPKITPQPIKEEYLLTGPLESSNQWYAIAKIAGQKLCEAYRKQYGDDFIAVMPTNIYGPGDYFDLERSHVLPALIRKFHEGKVSGTKEVVVWGTGKPTRDFLHVDDLAEACLFLMEQYSGAELVNIGTGEEISIKDLALLIKKIVGFDGEITLDATKPDGTPRRAMDVSKLQALGWKAKISLEDGLRQTYEWYARQSELRGVSA